MTPCTYCGARMRRPVTCEGCGNSVCRAHSAGLGGVVLCSVRGGGCLSVFIWAGLERTPCAHCKSDITSTCRDCGASCCRLHSGVVGDGYYCDPPQGPEDTDGCYRERLRFPDGMPAQESP